jgi:hypothetical protein
MTATIDLPEQLAVIDGQSSDIARGHPRPHASCLVPSHVTVTLSPATSWSSFRVNLRSRMLTILSVSTTHRARARRAASETCMYGSDLGPKWMVVVNNVAEFGKGDPEFSVDSCRIRLFDSLGRVGREGGNCAPGRGKRGCLVSGLLSPFLLCSTLRGPRASSSRFILLHAASPGRPWERPNRLYYPDRRAPILRHTLFAGCSPKSKISVRSRWGNMTRQTGPAGRQIGGSGTERLR